MSLLFIYFAFLLPITFRADYNFCIMDVNQKDIFCRSVNCKNQQLAMYRWDCCVSVMSLTCNQMCLHLSHTPLKTVATGWQFSQKNLSHFLVHHSLVLLYSGTHKSFVNFSQSSVSSNFTFTFKFTYKHKTPEGKLMCHMYRFSYLEFYVTVFQIYFYLNIHKTTTLRMGIFISVMAVAFHQ